MKASRFSDAQKAFILKHGPTGCRWRISAQRQRRPRAYRPRRPSLDEDEDDGCCQRG